MFVITLVVGVTLTVLSSARLFAASPLRMVSAVLVAQFALWFGLWCGWLILRGIPVGARRVAVVPIILLASTLRGLVLALLIEGWGIEEQADWFLRIVGSLTATSATVVVATIAVSAVQEHRRRLAHLLARQEQLRAAREDARQALLARRREVIARIRIDLAERIAAISEQSPDDAATTLQRAADEVVRPMSHELAQPQHWIDFSTAPVPVTRTDWRAVLADATTGRPVESLAITTLLALLAAPWAITTLPDQNAALLLAVGFVVVGLTGEVANAILVRLTPTRGPVTRAGLLTAALLGVGLVSGIASRLTVVGLPGAGTVVVGDAVLIPILGWLLAIGRAAGEQHRRLEERLERIDRDLEWELARVGEEAHHQQRALSRALHGPVQSAIGGAALRLELASRGGEPIDGLLEQVRGSLVAAVDLLDAPTGQVTDIDAALANVRGTYDGVCDVRGEVSAQARSRIAGDEVCAATVVEILTEATWNSVHHGRASQVTASVDLVDSLRLRLRVRDNGRAEAAVAPGLGTQVLDEVCTEWARASDAEGTVLTAILPIRP